jgi:sugar phosphate isomerase/epimerase
MKHAFMSFSCPRLSLGEMLGVAKAYGYDGIEPRMDSRHAHGVELETASTERRAIAAQVAESGVALACIATSYKYADGETVQQQVEQSHHAIDLAGDVGAPRLRVFGGAIPDGTSREAAIARVAGALRELASHAAEREVTLCLETHDAWCDVHHVAEVMRLVAHPAIGVTWDVMHPVYIARQTMDEAFHTLHPWIRHVHIHDGTTNDPHLQLRPIGQGHLDLRRAIQLLQESGYDGYLSGEWIEWEPYELHLPRELRAMQHIEAEVA